MSFGQWLAEDERPVVSFDFDGVLHIDMHAGTIHPKYWDRGDLRPRPEYVAKFKEEAKTNRVVIVSARCPGNRPEVEEFAQINGLPLSGVFLTCNRDKVPVLMEIGAIRHYDDDEDNIRQQMRYYGAEFDFIPVPKVGSQPAANL